MFENCQHKLVSKFAFVGKTTSSRRLLKFGLSLSGHEILLSRAKRGCQIRLSKSADSCLIFAYDRLLKQQLKDLKAFTDDICESCMSYYWNHSSELDALVNQDDHAAPIRNPICGRTGFSKSRGVRESVPFFPLPHPLPSTFFALAPIFACLECEKLTHTARILFNSCGYTCYAG